jgi:surface antigen
VRFGFISFNVVLLAIVMVFILMNRSSNNSVYTQSAAISSNNSSITNPLDQLSSADIAVTVAHMDSLVEVSGVTSQANSDKAELASAPTDNNISVQPQVAASAFKSNKDIQTYIAQAGDTLASVAAKFSVTSDSIKNSNGLSGTAITAGTKLLIPPISGIIYTVKSGDTPQSLATTYKASVADIIASNDAEIAGLQVGEQIIIPNATLPAPIYNAVASGDFAWGTTAIYGGNEYDYGFCTWYVATQISVPNNWGNASSWAYYARADGWTVSSTPIVGAIAQTPYAAHGEGHVAIVTAVSADGSQIQFKDMNGIAGWGRVGYSGWVSTSTFPNYIYH